MWRATWGQRVHPHLGLGTENMEKQFIELVQHVFTLQWAAWAFPVSLLMSMLVNRVPGAIAISFLAVVVHHIGPVAVPALLGGESFSVIANDIEALIPKLEPVSIVAEYLSYAYLIIVFSLSRQDMFRPGVTD